MAKMTREQIVGKSLDELVERQRIIDHLRAELAQERERSADALERQRLYLTGCAFDAQNKLTKAEAELTEALAWSEEAKQALERFVHAFLKVNQRGDGNLINYMYCSACGVHDSHTNYCAVKQAEKVLATSPSDALREHDAKVRRQVLLECLKATEGHNMDSFDTWLRARADAVESAPSGVCKGCDRNLPLLRRDVQDIRWRAYHIIPEEGSEYYCRLELRAQADALEAARKSVKKE